MKYHKPNPRVALVFPPFGPPQLASLGLAVLSAGVKRRGFECRQFYWSFRFSRFLPGDSPQERYEVYKMFTQRALFPDRKSTR